MQELTEFQNNISNNRENQKQDKIQNNQKSEQNFKNTSNISSDNKFKDSQEIVNSFKSKNDIKQIVSVEQNILKLNKDYQIQMFTGNSNIQLKDQNLKFLKPIIQNQQIVKVACGESHTLLLNNNGQVFSFGSTENGRLGIEYNQNQKQINECQLIEGLKDYYIQQIACGQDHNLCYGYSRNIGQNIIEIQNMNQVFSWGKGDQGQLGLGNNDDIDIPKMIQNFQIQQHVVEKIQCGENHSYVLFDNGELYSFGSNQYGQLGHNTYLPCYQPSKVELDESIINFSAGQKHIIVLTNKSIFYSWGNGIFGQLGNGTFNQKQKNPMIMSDFTDKSHIEIAQNSINIYCFKDQSFIIMPDFQKARQTRQEKLKLQRITIQNQKDNQLQNSQLLIQNKTSPSNSMDNSIIKQLNEVSQENQSIFVLSQDLKTNNNQNSKEEKQKNININSNSDKNQNGNEIEQKQCQQNQQEQQINDNIQDNHINQEILIQEKSLFNNFKQLLEKEKEHVEQVRIQQTFDSINESIEIERVRFTQIWEEEIIPFWGKKKSTEQVFNLCYKGIPPLIRQEIWYKAIPNRLSLTEDVFLISLRKAEKMIQYMDQKKQKTISEEMVKQIEQFFYENSNDSNQQSIIKEKSLSMIENDISRTFPYLPIFSQDSPAQQSLRQVLRAFTMCRPDIGYLQGMSYICAIFVLYLNKFQAFVCFTNLITAPSLMPFYLLDEEHIQQRLQIFKIIFHLNLPILCDHFERESIQPKLYVFEWMLTLYTKNLKLDTVCRIWDLLFVVQGPILLYKIAIGILTQLQSQLLKHEISGIMNILKKSQDQINEKELIEFTKKVEIPTWIIQEIDRQNQAFIP